MAFGGGPLELGVVGVDVGSSFVRAVVIDDRRVAVVNVDESVIGRVSWDTKTTLLEPLHLALDRSATRCRSMGLPLSGCVLSIPTMAGMAARDDLARYADELGLEPLGLIDHAAANLLYLWHLQPWMNGDRVAVVDIGRFSCDVAVADFSKDAVEIQGLAGFTDQGLDELVEHDTKRLVRRLTETIDIALDAAQSKLDRAVTRVALAGGRLRDRSLADLVVAAFDDDVEVTTLPRTAVAHGAALHAHRQRHDAASGPHLARLNSRTIGIVLGDSDTDEPLPTVLFRMNDRLPALVTEVLGTAADSASKAVVELVEQVLPDDVDLLFDVTSVGLFPIDGMGPSIPANAEVRVNFELTDDGKIRVASADAVEDPVAPPVPHQAGQAELFTTDPSESGSAVGVAVAERRELTEAAWMEPLSRTVEAIMLMVGVVRPVEQARLVADAVEAGATQHAAEFAVRHLIEELTERV